MNNTFPTPHDGAGDWSEYSRLVLHQLQQGAEVSEQNRKEIAELLSQQKLDRAAVAELGRELERRLAEQTLAFNELRDTLLARLDDPKKGLEGRTEALEDSNTVATAFKNGKVWVIGGAFIILTSIVLPTVSLFWKG